VQQNQIPSAIIEYYQELGWLKSNAAKLEARYGERMPEIRAPLQQIRSDAEFLQQKWLDWGRRHPRETPYSGRNVKLDRYYRSLRMAQRQLRDLLKSREQEVLPVVQAVAADVHAKSENCRHSADGLGKEINVTVHTRRGVEEVSGYEVWCAPMAFVKYKDEHIRFPRISSPSAIRSLAPGRYGMWVVKDRQASPAVPQTIGGRGERELEIDLLVPAGAGDSAQR
jgi:hypothetical protein